MKKRHGLNNYLWVAEHQKRGAIHYHCLLDMPYIPYSLIKEIFSNSFARFGISVSKENSVSASKTKGAIVKNVEQALRYITKYLTKQLKEDKKHNRRFWFDSIELGYYERDLLKREFSFKVFAKTAQRNTLSGRIYAFTNAINEKPLTITYEDFLKVSNTVKDVYNFRYCAVYICDLGAVNSLFIDVKQRILAQKLENHSYFYDKSQNMPIFAAIEDFTQLYKKIKL
jgi:hypothetical protein